MVIKIERVSRETWLRCAQLEVTEEQRTVFTAPPVYWMAECRYMDNWYEHAIFSDHELVGFAVYALDPDNDEYWIYAFMIDRRYQKKGNGKTAMMELIKIIRTNHNAKRIYLGHREQNGLAAKLYQSLGFDDTGERHGGEVIRRLEL